MVRAKPEAPPPAPRPAAPAAPIPSGELLRGGREVLILHRDELYRLRETKNGKLILTK